MAAERKKVRKLVDILRLWGKRVEEGFSNGNGHAADADAEYMCLLS